MRDLGPEPGSIHGIFILIGPDGLLNTEHTPKQYSVLSIELSVSNNK